MEELFVVSVDGFPGVRFPLVDESPFNGVDDDGGSGKTFELVLGVGGPTEENIDGNGCCC